MNLYDDHSSTALRKVRELHPDATRLLGSYSGGNDDGGFNDWSVLKADGSKVQIPYETSGGKQTVQSSKWNADLNRWDRSPVEVDASLYEMLDHAFEDIHGYGSFAGNFYVHGTVEIDPISGRCLAHHGQREVHEYQDF